MKEIYGQQTLIECQMQNVTAPVSLARLFQLLGNGEDLKICEELLSLKYSGLLISKDHAYYSLKMLRDYLTMTEDELSGQSSLQWMSLGMMHNGNCLTLNILESRKTGKGCSLSDILEKQVDRKYFLSSGQTAKLLNKSLQEVKETESMTQGGECNFIKPRWGMGAKTGLYLINKNKGEITVREDFNCLDANYYKGLDAHQARTGVLEVTPAQWRRTEKRKQVRRENQKTSKDYTPFNNGCRELVPKNSDVIGAITSQAIAKDSLLFDHARIRRLTPRECWRLQGAADEDYEKASAVSSESQLYKQAGNGATVNVIYEIARRLS